MSKAVTNEYNGVEMECLNGGAIGASNASAKSKIDKNGCTPLHRACMDSNYEEVDKLLCYEAVDINVTDNNGRTPLFYACEEGNEKIIQLLIASENKKDPAKFNLIKCDINHVDTYKRTALHIASLKGHTQVVQLLLEHKANVNLADKDKRTALDMACIEGHTYVVKLLLNHGGVDINRTDTRKCTPLQYACMKGHTQVVELLLEHKANINLMNESYGLTPLGIACIEGHTQTVELLLKHRADINYTSSNEYEPTLLHIACKKGHAQIVELLLKHNANVEEYDKNGLNPLDVAVVEGQKDAAMAIVKSDKWKEALRNYTDVTDVANRSITHFTTPMRRIIKKMPDVAKFVFDRCCETEKSPDDPYYKITYNYEFVEDFHQNWTKQSKYCSQNHCLSVLANSPSSELLKHPLATTLLDQKWTKYGQGFYYSNLIFYFLFVILLTSYALTVHAPNSEYCIEVFGNDTDTFKDCFSEERFVLQRYITFASVCLILYSTIMIIREAFQLFWYKLQYLTSFVNYIEVPLFIFTIMFASVRSDQCYCTRPWQWQVGVIAVFLSWIILIFIIRKLPVVGIYVVMFITILNNFIKVAILALLLISAFAVPFYMIFYDPQDRAEGIRTPFITPWRTFIKTIIMTMGEYDMDSLLRQNHQRNAPDVQYPVVAFSLIIVFVVLMPILFLNLLTSLAIGDTQKIQKSADIYALTLRVKFTLHIEEFLRKLQIRKGIAVQVVQDVLPNQQSDFNQLINKIERYFTSEPQATIAEVKNQIKPLSQEMNELRLDVRSSVTQEVKDLRSSVDQLQNSVDKLLFIVRQGGGQGAMGGKIRGLEEEKSLA